MMIKKGPVPIGHLLEKVLNSMDVPPPDVLSVVFGRWSELVGSAVAQHCKPVAIEGERLVVQVSDAVWASELQWLASDVLKRINKLDSDCRLESLVIRVVCELPKGEGLSDLK